MTMWSGWLTRYAPRSAGIGSEPDVHGKRALDLAVCLLLLLMAIPAMIVIAVAVLISSGRPVFYPAIRMGRGGEILYPRAR